MPITLSTVFAHKYTESYRNTENGEPYSVRSLPTMTTKTK